MLLALVTLFAATWAGLLRLGWQWPVLQPNLALSHGPLMIAGFFGTLIALERAVAMGKAWTYVGPLLSGIGGILLAVGIGGTIGPISVTLGSVWLVIIFIVILREHWIGYMIVMALGAVALLIGNLLWLFGWPVYQIVMWWAGFLILTIAGERLELGRMVQKPAYSQPLFFGITALYLFGLVVMLFSWDVGIRITGVGMLGLALWLLQFDIARQTVKRDGLTRFIAVCLLTGYVWLVIAGLIGIGYGGVPAGPIYDTLLHSIFLGFVFAMIFGHAPIIFPAVLGLEIEYKSWFYYPLTLLHISLVLRLGGEMMGLGWARLWGGLINVIAVLIYLVMISPLLQKQNNS
jgi:hypothetical protein